MFDFNVVNDNFYTKSEQEKIAAATVAITGAGGLGSNCAMILVRAGFRRFILADFDIITDTNLNRQFYRPDQIGAVKVETLKENLLEINPGLEIVVHNTRVTEDNLDEILADADVVVEAFDGPESKALISQKMFADPRPYVCVSGIAGYGNSDRIVTREMRNSNWIVGDGETGIDKAPPLAPAVLIAAAKEADVVLTVTLDR